MSQAFINMTIIKKYEYQWIRAVPREVLFYFWGNFTLLIDELNHRLLLKTSVKKTIILLWDSPILFYNMLACQSIT